MSLKQTFGARFDPAKDYMTPAEKSLFEDMREAGSISFFQVGTCEVCGVDVLKHKKFCSRACKEKDDETRGVD